GIFDASGTVAVGEERNSQQRPVGAGAGHTQDSAQLRTASDCRSGRTSADVVIRSRCSVRAARLAGHARDCHFHIACLLSAYCLAYCLSIACRSDEARPFDAAERLVYSYAIAPI